MNSASHSTVRASALIAALIGGRCAALRRKCRTSTMLTSAMSSSGYASARAARVGVSPWRSAACARATLQESVIIEPPMSQESRPRQTQPARVTGRLASMSSPMMASGANSRKHRSATEMSGTSRWSTTSYQPQIPFPRPIMIEETPNRAQAARNSPA